MKTYKLSDGNGNEVDLDAGTTKSDAELILANLPGWSLTSTGTDDRPSRRPRTAYRKGNKHGHWPLSSAVPREESLQRVLASERRVRMDDAVVVTMEYDPADRPVKK
jgi:hypothetical protein